MFAINVVNYTIVRSFSCFMYVILLQNELNNSVTELATEYIPVAVSLCIYIVH